LRVQIRVVSVNDKPVADNISATVTEDISNTVYLSSRDVEDGDNASETKYYKVSEPQYGSVNWNENINEFTFTPFDNLSVGTYTTDFEYRVKDRNNAESELGTVTLTVIGANDPPVANNVTDNITEGDSSTYNVTLSAIDNDTGDSLTYFLPNTPQFGLITSGPDSTGSFTFTPYDNLSNGVTYTETLTFYVQDNSSTSNNQSNNATVTLSILGTNDIPQALIIAAQERSLRTSRATSR
jgi:VCBS repeat-containing protein